MHLLMAVAFVVQSTLVQTPLSAKRVKMRPSRVIVCLDRTMFPHQFCCLDRLLSGIDSVAALRNFRRRKKCRWNHTTTSTGHLTQQSTTYCHCDGGGVLVLYGYAAIITNSATSATTLYATINPPWHNNTLYGGSINEFPTPIPAEKLITKSNMTIIHCRGVVVGHAMLPLQTMLWPNFSIESNHCPISICSWNLVESQ